MMNSAILPVHSVQITAEIKPNNLVKLLHINAKSIRSKSDDILTFIYSCNTTFDVVMFTATWYDNATKHFVLPEYKHFFLNQKNKLEVVV